jgi:hypothetical protein
LVALPLTGRRLCACRCPEGVRAKGRDRGRGESTWSVCPEQKREIATRQAKGQAPWMRNRIGFSFCFI